MRNTLGLNRKAPDEFRVVARPPLSVPDEFYLYPPDEAKERTEIEESVSAQSILFRQQRSTSSYRSHYHTDQTAAMDVDTSTPKVRAGSLPSTSETLLLQQLGANQIQGDIRSVIEQEYDERQKEDGLIERLRMPVKEEAVVVDAVKERERLNKKQQQGEAITADDVPTITETSTITDWLF